MHAAAQPVRAEDVHQQVGDGERDRGGLLHARDAPERPLAVELLHPHAALQRQVRQRVHAGVLAVVRARPAREPQREGHRRLLLLRAHRASWASGGVACAATAAADAAAVGVGGRAGLPHAFVEASLEHVRAIAGRSIGGGCDHEEEQAKRDKVQAHGSFALLCFVLVWFLILVLKFIFALS